jgi:hypothetical protein
MTLLSAIFEIRAVKTPVNRMVFTPSRHSVEIEAIDDVCGGDGIEVD